MKIELTLQEVRWVFTAIANYGAVSKEEAARGGEWHIERVAREQDVARVWKKVKTLAKKTGPLAWEVGPKSKDEEDGITYTLSLDDADRDGVLWLLLAALDPRSPSKGLVITLEEIVWPLAQKIRREKWLKKELKFADHKRIKIDDDPEPMPDGNGKPEEVGATSKE